MERTTPVHHGDQQPPSCGMVERIINQRIDGVIERLKENEKDIDEVKRGMDGHVGDLWKTLRKGQDDLGKLVSEHAKDDFEAMQTIQTQLLMRVPAWALAVMTIGASIIGAMATYILDHLK